MAGTQVQSETMPWSRKPIQEEPESHLQFLHGPEVNESFPLALLGLCFKKYIYVNTLTYVTYTLSHNLRG